MVNHSTYFEFQKFISALLWNNGRHGHIHKIHIGFAQTQVLPHSYTGEWQLQASGNNAMHPKVNRQRRMGNQATIMPE
jgi:hypothetical protein